MTSTWYWALKTALRRSFVATKTCVGWMSGKNGPTAFSRRLIAWKTVCRAFAFVVTRAFAASRVGGFPPTV